MTCSLCGLHHGPGTYADPSLPAETWGGRKAQQFVELTLLTYGDVCVNCGQRGANSADHVIPRSKGGAVYDIDNTAPSHRSCNYSRQDKPLHRMGIPVESGIQFFSE